MAKAMREPRMDCTAVKTMHCQGSSARYRCAMQPRRLPLACEAKGAPNFKSADSGLLAAGLGPYHIANRTRGAMLIIDQ